MAALVHANQVKWTTKIAIASIFSYRPFMLNMPVCAA